MQDLDRHGEARVARHHGAELRLQRPHLQRVGAQRGGTEQEVRAHVREIAGRRRLRAKMRDHRGAGEAVGDAAGNVAGERRGPVSMLASSPVISPAARAAGSGARQ